MNSWDLLHKCLGKYHILLQPVSPKFQSQNLKEDDWLSAHLIYFFPTPKRSHLLPLVGNRWILTSDRHLHWRLELRPEIKINYMVTQDRAATLASTWTVLYTFPRVRVCEACFQFGIKSSGTKELLQRDTSSSPGLHSLSLFLQTSKYPPRSVCSGSNLLWHGKWLQRSGQGRTRSHAGGLFHLKGRLCSPVWGALLSSQSGRRIKEPHSGTRTGAPGLGTHFPQAQHK